MSGPKRARAHKPKPSPKAPEAIRPVPDARATSEAPARDGGAPPPATTAAAADFVWPPPDAEIDAMEVVPLTTSSAPSTPVLHRAEAAEVNLLPGSSRLTARDLDRLSRLTRGESLDTGRTRVDWKRAGAIAALFLLVSGAFGAGLYLGARHARSGQNANPVVERTTETATNESARGVEAQPASPQSAGRPSVSHPEDEGRSGARRRDARPSGAPRDAVAASRSRGRSPRLADTPAAPSRRVPSTRSAADAGAGGGDLAAGAEPSSDHPPELSAAVLMPAPAGAVDTALAAVPVVPSAARRAEASGVITRAADSTRIRQTVERFERAYDALDAGAAHAVWPSLQVERLSRAFSALKSQALTFERCSITKVAEQTANVACAGSTEVVPRIGHGTRVSEALHWQFTLKRIAGEWLIDAVDVKRP
jgi:hypothetical protein